LNVARVVDLLRGLIRGVNIIMERKENKMKLLGMKDTIKFNDSGEKFVVTGFDRQGIKLEGSRGNVQRLTSHDFESLLQKDKIEIIAAT